MVFEPSAIVLLSRVCAVFNPAKSSSESAALNCASVPVNVLLDRLMVFVVSVSFPARVATVPLAGRVSDDPPAAVVKARFPVEIVRVRLPLLIPVPPYVGEIMVPCQVPVPIVPTVVRDELTTPDPRVVAFRTDVPSIVYAWPEERLRFDENVFVPEIVTLDPVFSSFRAATTFDAAKVERLPMTPISD